MDKVKNFYSKLSNAIKDFYSRLSNATKAALNSVWQTFVATFSVTLLGFLADVAKWADAGETKFPSLTPIAKAAVSAAAAAAAGFVTFVYRKFRDPSKTYNAE